MVLLGLDPGMGEEGLRENQGGLQGPQFQLKRSLELQEAAHGNALPAAPCPQGGMGHGVLLPHPSPAAPQAGECSDAFSTFDVPIFTEEFLDQNKGVGLEEGLTLGWVSPSPADPALSLQPGRPSCGACGR